MIILTGVLLIALPVAFNLVFGALAVQFQYPRILRAPTADVLRAFRAGGNRLVMTWWSFAMITALFIPVVLVISRWLAAAGPTVLDAATTLGILASVVMTFGLIRWPFMIPHLAREAEDASPAKAEAIDVVFQSLNRYLGVAIGEHLGAILTGGWTVVVSIAALQTGLLPMWMVVAGFVIGAALVACSLEFVGPFEREGWAFAGVVGPLAYIAWSLWLAAMGVFVLVAG